MISDIPARVRAAVDLAFHLRPEGVEFDDLFEGDWPLEDLANLYLVADEYRKTAIEVHKMIGAHLEPRLEGESVDVNGTLVWRGETKREKCIDPDGFWKWLSTQDDWRLVRKVFNEDYSRKGALPPAVRDTFYEKQPTGKVEVQSVPVEVLEQAKQKKALG